MTTDEAPAPSPSSTLPGVHRPAGRRAIPAGSAGTQQLRSDRSDLNEAMSQSQDVAKSKERLAITVRVHSVWERKQAMDRVKTPGSGQTGPRREQVTGTSEPAT